MASGDHSDATDDDLLKNLILHPVILLRLCYAIRAFYPGQRELGTYIHTIMMREPQRFENIMGSSGFSK